MLTPRGVWAVHVCSVQEQAAPSPQAVLPAPRRDQRGGLRRGLQRLQQGLPGQREGAGSLPGQQMPGAQLNTLPAQNLNILEHNIHVVFLNLGYEKYIFSHILYELLKVAPMMVQLVKSLLFIFFGGGADQILRSVLVVNHKR